jgi:hypothetical protein
MRVLFAAAVLLVSPCFFAQSDSIAKAKNLTIQVAWDDLEFDFITNVWSDKFQAYYATVHFSQKNETCRRKNN